MNVCHSISMIGLLLFGAVSVNAATTRYLNEGATQAQIQSTINASSWGDTVYLNNGKYYITSPLTFKSGITFRGGSDTLLTAYSAGSDVLFTLSNLSNVTFYKVKFTGIALLFTGNSAHTTGLNHKVNECTFKNSKQTRFVQFNFCKNGIVKNSTFTRGKNYEGKVIKLDKSHFTTISGNTMSGYLETAINISGGLDYYSLSQDINYRTYSTDILNNTITRTGGVEEDHGIYAIAMKDLLIEGNTISGWSPTGTGGAVKVRNGEDVKIMSNTFNDSGVLLYTYDSKFPKYLKNVTVRYNTMNISGSNSASKGRGVFYLADKASHQEQDFWIKDNDINNGAIVLVDADIDVPEVNGSVGNNDCPIISLKSGITAWGNELK